MTKHPMRFELRPAGAVLYDGDQRGFDNQFEAVLLQPNTGQKIILADGTEKEALRETIARLENLTEKLKLNQ